MSETITLKQTIQIRGRADALFRLVLDPNRRAKWDPNIQRASYVGEEKLGNGTMARFKLPTRLLGLSFTARYGQYQAPHRGGWESVRPFGPVEKLTQGWVFRSVPGGTEVTFTTTARVRFRWIQKPIERVLQAAMGQTLVELQRQVDRQGAELIENTSREMARAQREARKKKR